MKKIFLSICISILLIASVFSLNGCQLSSIIPGLIQPEKLDMLPVYELFLDRLEYDYGDKRLSYRAWVTAVHGDELQKGVAPKFRKNEKTDSWEISYNN